MAQDIRLNVEFYGHPKTVRFYGRTGDQGIVCLTRLWIFTSRYFPRGILTGMTTIEIADAAGWKGEPQEFVAALLEAGGPGRAGFLDRVDTNGIRGYAIHDWQTHNPFAYFKEERSEIARINIQKRWNKKRKTSKNPSPNKNRNDDGIPSVYGQNTPSPTPSPPPKGREEGDLTLPLALDGAADRAEDQPLAPPNALRDAMQKAGLVDQPLDKPKDRGNGTGVSKGESPKDEFIDGISDPAMRKALLDVMVNGGEMSMLDKMGHLRAAGFTAAQCGLARTLVLEGGNEG